MRIHSSPLGPGEVVETQGLPVTSVVRTAIDLARGQALPDALIPLDSAVRHLLGGETWELRRTRPDDLAVRDAVGQLRRCLGRVRSWPGTALVWRALELVDARSESALESRSRGWIHEARLPVPEIALPVRGASGADYLADFGWADAHVLGEADGTGKYGGDERQVRAALRAERRRQRDLEDAGWQVVRWESTEPPAVVLARLRRALA